MVGERAMDEMERGPSTVPEDGGDAALPDGGRVDGFGSESMTSRAYARLKADIMAGRLRPGSKLKIGELRDLYATGASPIREALSLLTSDHFVERIDQRGFRVAKVSTAEFGELLKTSCWLEERALRESVARGSQRWEEKLVLANYRLSRIPRSTPSDVPAGNGESEEAHKRFHMALIEECGSSLLLKFCGQLYEQNIRYRQLSVSAAYPARDIAEEHNAICDAALARDADLASRLLIAHYTRTGDFVLQQFAERPGD